MQQNRDNDDDVLTLIGSFPEVSVARANEYRPQLLLSAATAAPTVPRGRNKINDPCPVRGGVIIKDATAVCGIPGTYVRVSGLLLY